MGRHRIGVRWNNYINLNGNKSSATLTYSWFIESRWDNGENIRLDISTDGGSSWTENVASIDGTSRTYYGPDENHWINEEINLGSQYMVSNFKIRFRAQASSTIGDGDVDNVKIVSIGGAPNNLPVAYDQSVTTDEDTSISITLTATDPDGDSLT